MKSHKHFILHQALRFGAISMSQLLRLCNKTRSQRTLYRDVEKLIRLGYLIRVIHPMRFQIVLMATPKASGLVYSPNYVRPRTPRMQDLNHMLACTEVLLELACYSNVTGIATEFELTPTEVKDFSLNRTPDGIIQITRSDATYELAVEYEAYQKDAARISKILETYDTVFKTGSQCGGLILIAGTTSTFEQYQKILTSKSDVLRKRVILKMPNELAGLNPAYYGRRLTIGSEAMTISLQKVRHSCQGGISYSPIISTDPCLSKTPIDTDIEGQSIFEV